MLLSAASFAADAPGTIKGTVLEPSPENLALTWTKANLVLPASLAGGRRWEGRAEDAPDVIGIVPLVVVMHGSSGVAPAITWRPDTDTQLTVSGFYQRDPKGGYFNSLYPQSLAPAAYRPYLNRNLNIGDPGFDRFEREQSAIGYVFDRRLNDVVSVHSALRYAKVDTDFQSLQMAAGLTAAGTIPRAAIRSIESVDGVTADNRLRFDFRTASVEHSVIAGWDQQNSHSSWIYQFGAATSLDVVNPAYYQPVGTLFPFINNDQSLSQTGLYVQDQMKLGGFRLTLGTRHDWTAQTTDNRISATRQSQDSDKQTYRAGLLYLFDNGLA
ncbi:MAG: hypothetical protein E6575_28200, partial [Bradyrhizobium sp.]|nr:hypothetical protein [Bradyrhizobium sp.]